MNVGRTILLIGKPQLALYNSNVILFSNFMFSADETFSPRHKIEKVLMKEWVLLQRIHASISWSLKLVVARRLG